MKRIGIFDSGVGGLTVVREIRRLMPSQPIIYFGDTARTPYGTKGPDTLIQYSIEDAAFLLEKGADIIVIACHSAASTATSALKERFNVPIFEVISPSVNQSAALTRKRAIGLIGTRATVSSGIYEREISSISSDIKVFTQACSLLVPLVEEGWLKARETRMIVRKYLRGMKGKGIDVLVLGCTHYPLLKKIIQKKMGRSVKIVDPSEEVARMVYEHLREKGELAEEREADRESRFYLSDITPATRKIVERFLGEDVGLEKVVLPCSHVSTDSQQD
jgi:glutamate racemase